MKKLILMTILVSLMAAPAMAIPTFAIQKADLLTMTELDESASATDASVSIVTDSASIFTTHRRGWLWWKLEGWFESSRRSLDRDR